MQKKTPIVNDDEKWFLQTDTFQGQHCDTLPVIISIRKLRTGQRRFIEKRLSNDKQQMDAQKRWYQYGSQNSSEH